MKLEELTVHGFRGFPPEEHSLEFGGDNAVILGDNGTGKSSVLAAVEFLLTGGLSYLSGPGTGDFNISSHAPHQNASPEDCYVQGVFIDDDGNRGVFKRSAETHGDLERIEGAVDVADVSVSQWNDEHLLLTRGDLLEFIEAPPSDRGKHLSKLLNLSGITNRSRGFSRITNKLEERAQRKEAICERQVQDIDSAIDAGVEFPLTEEDVQTILDEVNKKLSSFGGQELTKLDSLSENLDKLDISVTQRSVDSFYESSTQNRLSAVRDWSTENIDDINERLDTLAAKLAELDSAEDASLNEIDFFEEALNVVNQETTVCPLCGEAHDEEYLIGRVESERDRLSSLRNLREEIERDRASLVTELQEHRNGVEEVLGRLDEGISSGDHDAVEEEVEVLGDYLLEVESIIDTLEDELVHQAEDGSVEVQHFNPEELSPPVDSFLNSAGKILDYSDDLEPLEEQSSLYQELVTIRNGWESLQQQESALESRTNLVENMTHIENLFKESKSEKFQELYSDIEDHFNNLYSTIHPDEQEIELDFNADGTNSVELEANFEGERDSPLAFHSEGHIDTMGICLFLALRNHLSSSGPDIVMLDDIVMSVDKNHRSGVARLLRDYLESSPQGILATHDEVWADQLTDTGVVNRNNVYEIYDWDISTGPMMGRGSWDVIEGYIDDNRPHAAAAHMRRQAEKLGRIAAILLKPKMEYKERYGLADFIYAISGRISTVATEGKKQYEQNTEEWEAAKELDDRRSDLLGDFRLEELNGMVHYRRDDWGQLRAEDLRGVLEHWKEIDEFLHCEQCGEMIKYQESGDWCWIQCDCREMQVGYED